MTWTFKSSATGYMLYKNGIAQQGAGTTAGGYSKRRRPWQHVRADAKMFRESAARQCLNLNKQP